MKTVAEYVVAGGVQSMAVLPVPPTASLPAGAHDPAGVSDVYSRTLAGARVSIGAGHATLSARVGVLEAGSSPGQ